MGNFLDLKTLTKAELLELCCSGINDIYFRRRLRAFLATKAKECLDKATEYSEKQLNCARVRASLLFLYESLSDVPLDVLDKVVKLQTAEDTYRVLYNRMLLKYEKYEDLLDADWDNNGQEWRSLR